MTYNIDHVNEITEGLYLGNLFTANNIEVIKNLGVTKVLSLIEGFRIPKYNESDNIKHKVILINDSIQENIIKYFGECLYFINGEEKVLVHCAAGTSRSATIVIAYLMWKNKGMTFENVLNYVKDKRKISPNLAFQEQLQLFEKILKENDYNIDKIKFNEIDWKPKEGGYFFN